MPRSAVGVARSVSVALLLPESGSVVPAGAVTVAVLTRLPVAAGLAVPVTVKTTALPVPAARLTVAARRLPTPVAPLVTAALPALLEVHVTPDKMVGRVSATPAPTTLTGPRLVTVIVYVTTLPGVYVAEPSVFV